MPLGSRRSRKVPVVVVLVLAVVAGVADPATLAFFVNEPIGVLCLVVGVGLDVAGFVWMRRIAGSVT